MSRTGLSARAAFALAALLAAGCWESYTIVPPDAAGGDARPADLAASDAAGDAAADGAEAAAAPAAPDGAGAEARAGDAESDRGPLPPPGADAAPRDDGPALDSGAAETQAAAPDAAPDASLPPPPPDAGPAPDAAPIAPDVAPAGDADERDVLPVIPVDATAPAVDGEAADAPADAALPPDDAVAPPDAPAPPADAPAPIDAAADLPPGIDAAEPDAPIDAAVDAPPDAPADAPPDSPPDAAPPDSPADAGADAADARPPCLPVINELQTGGAGGDAGSGADEEFVEIYNTCPGTALSLAGYRLVYRSASGASDIPMYTFSQTIPAGDPYFVLAHDNYTGPNADARTGQNLAAAGGGVALRAPDTVIIDSVGWGSATNAFVEGTAAAAPASAKSIARTPDGKDTDNNSADFAVANAPTPGAANP